MAVQRIKRHKQKIKQVAVLTSGGDSPGMNAAVRAVVRSSIFLGLKVFGVHRGYSGLLDNDVHPMDLGAVANIIQRGGTILKTARCPEFLKKSARKRAAENLRNRGIDGLVVIGGDGSFRGAHALATEFDFPIIGIPGTIDNDVFGTDITIGFDTATNTGLRAIDQIRDTANSHERIFVVEVMGRNTGFLAMDVGIGGGADAIVVPEAPLSVAKIAQQIKRGEKRGKKSCIIVVAEGNKSGKSIRIADQLQQKYGYSSRVCILGHIQRGGSPTARDRKVASGLGSFAVRELAKGFTDAMGGIRGRDLVLSPLVESFKKRKTFQKDLLALVEALAT